MGAKGRRSHLGRAGQSSWRQGVVVDAVSGADVEHARGARLSDCVLNEARNSCRERGVELAGVDKLGNALDELGAATRGIQAEPYRCSARQRRKGPVL